MSKIHLTRDDIKYTSNPIGNLVTDYVGQYCITNDNKVFFANGFTSNDWIEAGGSGLVAEEEFNEFTGNVINITNELSASVTNLNNNVTNITNEINGSKASLCNSLTDLINKL